MKKEDVLIYVDNVNGKDTDPGTQHNPVETAGEAFRHLPPFWYGRAEIIFAATGRDYPLTTDAVFFGTPIGPEASPLVIRGEYAEELVTPAADSSGDEVSITTGFDRDRLIGSVLARTSDGGWFGVASSIRGNSEGPNSTISLQRNMGDISRTARLAVQRPAVKLSPARTLSLTSHDGRSPNLTLIGIEIAPEPGAGLNLLNVRAQCDTCWFSFRKLTVEGSTTSPTFYVHTNSRVQGGIEGVELSPELPERPQAGAYINGDDASCVVWAARGGILGGHLTFKTITVRVSQGGAFVPKSLEGLASPVHILTGGTALGEKEGWGTTANKARIRGVEATAGGDGLRVFNGGSIHSPLAPINLDIYGCQRDGIRLDMGSTASFGPPGGRTGLVTSDAANLNRGFGMNVRNASRALIGTDTALKGNGPNHDVALDDGRVDSDRAAWSAITPNNPLRNAGMAIVRLNT